MIDNFDGYAAISIPGVAGFVHVNYQVDMLDGNVVFTFESREFAHNLFGLIAAANLHHIDLALIYSDPEKWKGQTAVPERKRETGERKEFGEFNDAEMELIARLMSTGLYPTRAQAANSLRGIITDRINE